ncbi:MAG: alpha-1,2-fucosyltransferase [Planctomycetia bacterium]|nr:alpha-1,2-fucosyltransferase [Planctomycetia bacterium]
MAMGGSIEVMLRGGLGNQMFQYALGRALSIRSGLPLVFDLSALGFDVAVVRKYELACFRLCEHGMRKLPVPVHWAREKGLRILARFRSGPGYLIKEPSIAFEPGVLCRDRPCRLDGYWQSERYFDSISARLRVDFEFLPPQDPRNANCSARIQMTNAVGLHIRRSDYVSDPTTSAFHGTCSSEYYDAALKLVRSRLGSDPELFVFSDDIEWVRENLSFPFPATCIDWNQGRGFEDLRLMSACRALVIANSAFSWWAGWLNPDPRKLVVAPRRWYRAAGMFSELPDSKWLIAL